MPTQIRFDGTIFTVLSAVNGQTVETGYTPADIARRMMEKFAKEHPYYPANVYNDYYDVIMDSAKIAMTRPNEDVAIYDRKNAPEPTPPPKQRKFSSYEEVERVYNMTRSDAQAWADAHPDLLTGSLREEWERFNRAVNPNTIPSTKPDSSIAFFKTLLNYKPISLQNGEKGLSASIGSYATFVVTQRGSRYHTDVFYQGKKIIIGNYNLKDWAMYEGPYFWWQKNIGTIADIPKLLTAPVKPEHEAKGVPIGYEGWEKQAENLWVKNLPAYQLTVQFYNGSYSSTVKDTKHFRVYSDATHFATLKEAMNAATTRVVKLASQETTANRNRDIVSTTNNEKAFTTLSQALMNIPSLMLKLNEPALREITLQIADKLKAEYAEHEISLREIDAIHNRLDSLDYKRMLPGDREAMSILRMLITELRTEVYTALNPKPQPIKEEEEYRPSFQGKQGRLF